MTVFVKHNAMDNDALLREAEGLARLKTTIEQYGVPYIRIPEVVDVSRGQLTLQRIHSKPATSGQMFELGKGLAALHNIEQKSFGFDCDNFIGLGKQHNCITRNWGRFFVEWRLLAQIKKIKRNSIKTEFEKVVNEKLEELVRFLDARVRQASLLHGDLWSGNVLFDETGPWLIDPAVYFGDAEADIAMTHMFGGFGTRFYQGYRELRAVPDNSDLLHSIYNLYHYLNHYNLFGDSYLAACHRGLRLIKLL